MQKVINFPKKSEKIRLLSLFSGIGAFEKALKRLGHEYELVNYCEIDKYASKAYSLIHGVKEDLNLGDITKIDETKLQDIDLMTYGFPCQDISIAGQKKGIIEGETRSGLLFDALRILKYKKPKYAIAENVKNLISKKFRPDFEKLLDELDSYGYNNYWAVLNGKDFGIPQNRERVFIVSIRKDIDDGSFRFPEGFRNGIKLLDTLENADEKYYLSKRAIESLEKHNIKYQEKGNGFIWKVRDLHGHASTIRANGALAATDNTIMVPASVEDILESEADEKYYIPSETAEKLVMEEENALCDPDNNGKVLACITPERIEKRQNGRRFKKAGEPMFTITSQDRHGILIAGKFEDIKYEQDSRVYDTQGISPTLTTKQCKFLDDYRIRKLTPLECFRLMGFDDLDFYRAKYGLNRAFYKGRDNSDSQLYRMAGNSIVVDVLVWLLRNLFVGDDQTKELDYPRLRAIQALTGEENMIETINSFIGERYIEMKRKYPRVFMKKSA